MKKSLLITYFFPPKIGGIENYLMNLCVSLPTDKIVVLTENVPQSHAFDDAQKYQVIRKKIFAWKLIRPSWLPLIFSVKKIIKQEKIEILQFGHYSNLATIGLIYKMFYGLDYIVYTHGVDTLIPQKSWLQKKLMLLNLQKASWIIANTQYMRKRLIKLGLPEAKILVLYPSLNIDIFGKKYDTSKIFKSLGLTNENQVILSIGRLIERKGQDMVIKSLPAVIKRVPQVKYIIIGDGPYRQELVDLTKNMALENYVIFFGSVPDEPESKLPFYQMADIFILPTRELDQSQDVESFGLVYLEAQASGLPVILGRSGGTRETIIENETGLMVDALNPDQISQAIIDLLTNHKISQKMGERGRLWVTGTFDWRKQINKLRLLIEPDSGIKSKIPKISIIIPAFQSAEFLPRCLESVFDQTFKDYEIIVVNDGSTDETAHVLDRYRDRIIIINQNNQGAANARNNGAKIARGEFLFFCDADVILDPKILQKMYLVLRLNPFVSFCYSAFKFGWRTFKAVPFSSERLRKYNFISTMSLVRKIDFPGFDPALKRFQDWDLWLKMAERHKVGLAWPEILFRAPLRKEGISSARINRIEALKVIKSKHHL